jgi:hypothetical protein
MMAAACAEPPGRRKGLSPPNHTEARHPGAAQPRNKACEQRRAVPPTTRPDRAAFQTVAGQVPVKRNRFMRRSGNPSGDMTGTVKSAAVTGTPDVSWPAPAAVTGFRRAGIRWSARFP